MSPFLLITLVLSGFYGGLMLLYSIGWGRQEKKDVSYDDDGTSRFSIIIPARNEEENIGALLTSIFTQGLPPDRFEVIVVDDHSTDDTAVIVGSYSQPNLSLLRLAEHVIPGEALNSAKKRALALGIAHAKYPVIITTDADCVVPAQWLRCYAAAYSKSGVVLAAAPVDFSRGHGVLYLFQSLDFMAMQGITAAASALRLGTMSNGANLSFSRAAFEEVGGYAGVNHLASGDDYLLTLKLVKQYGASSARYLLARDAIVRTAAQPTWSFFLQQRVRWASKSGKYNDPRMTAILIGVYGYNLWFVVLTVAALVIASTGPLLAAALLFKTIVEILFLYPVARFFSKRHELIAFPFLQPLHILYVVLAGFLGMRGGYRWKGRQVR